MARTAMINFVFVLGVALLATSPCAKNTIELTPTRSCKRISKDLFGANSKLTNTPLRYDNPLLHYFLAKYKLGAIRVPGGTSSSTIDWENGAVAVSECARKMDDPCPLPELDENGCNKDTRFCKDLKQRLGASGDTSCVKDLSVYWGKKLSLLKYRNGRFSMDELEGLLTSKIWKGNIVYVINLCGTEPKASFRLATAIKAMLSDRNRPPGDRVRFELGNELYALKYKNCVKDSIEYEARAREHAREIKKADPSFKVSVVMRTSGDDEGLPPVFKHEGQNRKANWAPQFPRKAFETCESVQIPSLGGETRKITLFDAVSRHNYFHTSETEPTELELLSKDERRLWKLVKRVRDDFEQSIKTSSVSFKRPVWITEYGPNATGLPKSNSSFQHSFYAGLYRVLVQLVHMTNPMIEVADFHALQTLFGVFKVNALPGECDNSDAYMVPMNGTMKQNDKIMRQRLTLNPGMVMSLEILGPIYTTCQNAQRFNVSGNLSDEVNAVLFQCGTKNRVVMVSTTKRKFQVEVSQLPGLDVGLPEAGSNISILNYRVKPLNSLDTRKVKVSVADGYFPVHGFSTTVLTYDRKNSNAQCDSFMETWSMECPE